MDLKFLCKPRSNEEHEDFQLLSKVENGFHVYNTKRFIPSFNILTLKFISRPKLMSANFI